MIREIFNWGIFPKINANVISSDHPSGVFDKISKVPSVIARGNGRCYGDSSLQSNIFSTLRLNRFLSFDDKAGIITCEAGVLLSEMLEVIVPKGFFLPVTPGTKLITLGGAIAANVHGKNHHSDGAISLHVLSFKLLLASGEIIHCSLDEHFNIYKDTIGGMGLTGIITEATIQLKKIETSYIKQKSLKAKDLREVFDYFERYEDYTYSVAWIDCLATGKSIGKSILMLGEHASAADLSPAQQKQLLKQKKSSKGINVPFFFPAFTLNKFTIKAFNLVYYNKQRKKELNNVIHYEPYFYPLDILNNWNRIYGKSGFLQYQFVLPLKDSYEGLQVILQKIADSGEGSFLAVLKLFGEADKISSDISFPERGYTLALDFKVSDKVFRLLDELDKIILSLGGKFYLAKDSRMSAETFHACYASPLKHADKFQSLQSERLGF